MIVVSSRSLAVSVLPAVGGKVAQIRHLASEANLLVPPRRPYRTLDPTRPWTGYDTSGMDDCFPNVDEGPYPEGPWRDLPLPQLGEWVRGEWEVASATPAEVTLARTGSVLPYTARKRVSFIDDRTIQIEYEARNTGDRAFRYIWSAHPLISAGETFALRIPGRELPCVTFPDRGMPLRWPTYESVDLSSEWIRKGATLKLFVTGLAEGWCELHTAGRRFRFEFDLDAAPVLGLWFNNYGFPAGAPFRCIAVEPCTSPTDVLHALPASAYPFLAPGSSAAWSFRLRID